jgi:hypothetical protein
LTETPAGSTTATLYARHAGRRWSPSDEQ